MSILPCLALLLTATPPAAVDTVVVCPTAFRAALAPWVAYRTSQGHRIELVSGELSALELRTEIRSRAKRGSLAYVVLVGDATPTGECDPALRLRTVPTWQAAAKVIPRYGGEASIASDNGYADLDDDALPDIAVGRLTAHNPDELARMVEKILAYERNADFGAWRRQVNVLAGVGGFGPWADAAIESAARRVISAGIPPAYAMRITYGNWRSPYCPEPSRFHQAAAESLSEGSLFWIYLGHAWPDRLADLHVPGAVYASLDRVDVQNARRSRRRSDRLFVGLLHRRFRRRQRLPGRNHAGHARRARRRDLRVACHDAVHHGRHGHGAAERDFPESLRHGGPRTAERQTSNGRARRQERHPPGARRTGRIAQPGRARRRTRRAPALVQSVGRSAAAVAIARADRPGLRPPGPRRRDAPDRGHIAGRRSRDHRTRSAPRLVGFSSAPTARIHRARAANRRVRRDVPPGQRPVPGAARK